MIKGKVHKYGDDINTDVIFPGRYTYKNLSEEEMAQHAMEDLDPDFSKKVNKGDVIVAGKNFGMGSSREQAVLALKYAGISAIIAKSFARIYFRNAINSGLPAIELPELVDKVNNGDEIELDLEKGIIKVPAGEFKFPPFPEKVREILQAGGLIPYIKSRI
ncbi:MAG: 3-isopropylmalate dehydratase small subunit [Candidatus Aminicenantes bacterium]|nr:3-isopropylmalate dehydratase small subunit [Candidatus Aminicenantes bacterium]